MLFSSTDEKNQEDLDHSVYTLLLHYYPITTSGNKARNEKYQELFMPSRDISHELNKKRMLVWFIFVVGLAAYMYL
jgi:hypothetical protein